MKISSSFIFVFLVTSLFATAQDSLYIYYAGSMVNRLAISQIDSAVVRGPKTIVYTDSVTDIDGNLYHAMTIGSQTWTIENLKTTKYNDGTSIPLIEGNEWNGLTSPAYYNYGNNTDGSMIDLYGRLYNWMAVNTGKLCPPGWHVPTDQE